MDEIDTVSQTLNAVVQRHVKSIHTYEIEITNMMAEMIRLQKKISKLEEISATKEDPQPNKK
jgi:hypothetical protein